MEDRHINFLYREEPPMRTPPKIKKWRIFLFFAFMAFIFSTVWTVRVIFNEPVNDPGAYDPTTLEPKKPDGFFKKITNYVFTDEYRLKGYSDDRINILLLGISGPGHDGPFLTDTIIIASIKPSTGQIALISVPRDMQIEIPDKGLWKANHAESFGMENGGDGPAYAAKIISDTIGIDLPYYAQVDFQAFLDIVNYVGGVTVNVERTFVDEMYPTAGGGYQTIVFQAGEQTMSGETALKFARSRHGSSNEASDFARAKRQQKVVFALKKKIMSASTLANPIRISKIIDSLQKHIATNLQFADIMYLLKLSRNIDTKEVITAVLDNSVNGFLIAGTGEGGAYVLTPKTGNYKAIRKYIENIFTVGTATTNDTPAQTLPPNESKFPPANIEVQNGTWTAGLAARMRKRLEDRGIIITTIDNSEIRPQSNSAIYNLSKKDLLDQMQILQNELQFPIKEDLPNEIETATSTEILVLIGEDNIE